MSRTALPRWVPWAACALAVAAFASTPSFGFVYDDHRFVAGNAALGDLSVIWRAFVDPAVQTGDGTHAGLWRPLRTLSFALDRLVFGDAAWGHHAMNVALHGAGVWLVTRLLGRWGAGAAGALLGGLVYALHPAAIESVAWISSRGDLLAAALVWSALLVARSPWALVLGSLALLSKEQAVVWPALVVLHRLLEGQGLRAALRDARGAAIATLVFVAVRHGLLAEPFQEGGLDRGAPGTAEMIGMLAHQSARAVVPVAGTFDWQMPWPPRAGVARLVLAIVGLAPLVLTLPRRSRVAALWFLAALGPTLFVQWVVPLNIRTADRFLLFALPAVACVVARGVTRVPRAVPAAGLVVLGLAGLTAQALPQWRSESTLWADTVASQPRHWRARSWLGADALRRGDPDAAARHLQIAADVAPADAKTHFLLGQAYQGQAPRAARDDGDRVVELTVLARAAYGRAVGLWTASPPIARQEGRDGLLPLARVRGVDLTLALGDRASAGRLLGELLATEPPQLTPDLRAVWEQDVELLAAHIEEFGIGPVGGGNGGAAATSSAQDSASVARRLRNWAAQR